MKKKSSIPIAMLTKKFYCHKCGERLSRYPNTRTVKPGDADYREHSRLNHRTHMVGEVELTEYDFKCLSCDKITPYDEQCLIEKIQKYVRRHTLLQTEIAENQERAKAALERKRKITGVIVTAVGIIVIALVLYMWVRSGDFSLKLYF